MRTFGEPSPFLPSPRWWARAPFSPETNGMVRVRRERRLVHSGCKSHPGTGSFRPVAIGAAVEVTKLLKPPVEEGR